MSSINPVLVRATRSGFVESQFRGSVSVMTAEGRELFSLGHSHDATFPRSTLKFFQVLPLLASGAANFFQFSDSEIAVMCASHNAEAGHLAAVESILSKIGLSEQHLSCGAHRPLGIKAADELAFGRKQPGDIHNNCSGKHAGFLALAQFLQAHLPSYLDPEHEIQLQIRAIIADYCGMETEMYMGIDGCSAPNYAMPLRNLAWGMARITAGYGPTPAYAQAATRVVRSVTNHPWLVAGTDRYCTDLMTATQGKVIGKLGADGIYLIGLPDHRIGIAIKMDDGSTGPQYQASQRILEELGILSPEAKVALSHYTHSPILNCNGAIVGERKAVDDIWTGLSAKLFSK